VLKVEPNLLFAEGNSPELGLVDIQSAVDNADIHVILVKHRAFSQGMLDHVSPDWIVDSCGLFPLM